MLRWKLALILAWILFASNGCLQRADQQHDHKIIETEVKDFIKDSSISHLSSFIKNYTPTHIELCHDIKDSLSKFDLDYIFSNSNDTLKRKLIFILLLKGYRFHLLNTHQGFNLLSMRDGNCKLFIDEYIKLENLEHEHEFLNSGYIYYNTLRKKELKFLLKDDSIQSLMRQIDAINKDLSLH